MGLSFEKGKPPEEVMGGADAGEPALHASEQRCRRVSTRRRRVRVSTPADSVSLNAYTLFRKCLLRLRPRKRSGLD